MFLVGVVMTPEAGATVLTYWNMDAPTTEGKLSVNAGSQAGIVTASIQEFSAGFISGINPDVAGTTLNVLGPEGSPNRGVGFFRIGTVFAQGTFVMSGFDFTGLSAVVVSFAYQSAEFFTWDENLHVDYRINSGSWVDIQELQTWAPNYSLASVSFGNLLDNAASVDLRIRTVNWGSTFGYLDIDNVRVTAIPEPANAIVFGLALLYAMARRLGSFSKIPSARQTN
jgi:hypothetical protein